MARGKTTKRSRLVLALSLGIFALVLLAPAANAQVTVYHVKVQVDTVTYCDQGTSGCTVTVWPTAGNFPVSLVPGQTLLLTQTGTINSAGGIVSNFDTSGRASPTGENSCNGVNACPVTIFLDTTGTGFGAGITPPTANALNNFNNDTGNEGVAFTTVATTTSYTLGIGYADTAGIAPTAPSCVSATVTARCLPAPWTSATKFIGAPMSSAAGNACDGQCWDAGALLITAQAVPNTCPLTQGFWKNHFPGSWPASVVANGLKIGSITYTAAQLEANLETPPSGGNALVILSHQLITALLNQANGSNTSSISATITAAQTLIDGLNINTDFVAAGSSLGQQMTALADILDAFNSSSPAGCTL